MAVRDILLLGNPKLYETSRPVRKDETEHALTVIRDLHDTMLAFQAAHGWGRAIAAPQIGLPLRIVCMRVDQELSLINPVLDDHSEERMTVWEDCMSFPELLVRLSNPRRCRLTYHDTEWQEHRVELEGDYAELLQHEVDHLDGILSVQRALDGQSIALRRAMPKKDRALTGAFRQIAD